MNVILLIFLSFILVGCGNSKSTVKGPKTENKEAEKEPLSICKQEQKGEVFHDGLGDSESPFVICKANQLQEVKNYPDKVFVLGDNINLESIENFIPIGGCGGDYSCVNTDDDPFSGSFDGNGYTISNLKMNIDSDTEVRGAALFGRVESSAVVTNFRLDKAKIDILGDGNVFNSAALFGTVQYAMVKDVKVSNSQLNIRADVGQVQNIGMIAGNSYNSFIDSANVDNNSKLKVVSHDARKIGGAIGYTGYGIFEKSYSKADLEIDVSGKLKFGDSGDPGPTNAQTIGGFVGHVYNNHVWDSFVSESTIKILRNDTSVHRSIAGFIGAGNYAKADRNFVNNVNFEFIHNAGVAPLDNPDLAKLGAFIGNVNYGYFNNNFVLNSPILPNDSSIYSTDYSNGSFLGYGYYGYFYYNYTSGSNTQMGYLYSGSGPIASPIIEADVKGNNTHAVFDGWDFNAIWKVETSQLPSQVSSFGRKAERNPSGIVSYANSAADQAIVLNQKFIDDLKDFADKGTTDSEVLTSLVIYSGWTIAELKTALTKIYYLKPYSIENKFKNEPNILSNNFNSDIAYKEALIHASLGDNKVTPLEVIQSLYKLYPEFVIQTPVTNCNNTYDGNKSKSLLSYVVEIPVCITKF